ncbi:putative thioredoxin-like protein [Rosa chinensis]|uniref:Putative thioredoxin-like protein n=1 Tax=Rosa chinensis TaxID=74649 RepID=A0A2P6QKF7_ROSCH|nr:putative thioredoxin-like protein [Rosa chinensis]
MENDVNLSEHSGKVLLIVNVASKWFLAGFDVNLEVLHMEEVDKIKKRVRVWLL